MDIYVLAHERSSVEVERFLTHYLPDRERSDLDYWVTLDGTHPAAVLDSPEDMARFCEANPEAESRAYWTSHANGDVHSAHVFFLQGGGLVLGLSVVTQDQKSRESWLTDLLTFTRSEYGYWTFECPPENSVSEFIELAIRHAESADAPSEIKNANTPFRPSDLPKPVPGNATKSGFPGNP
jgi:hypothetical protein